MSSLLDAYLEEVAVHLSPLPTERRTEELHEMRQHLLNAAIVNKELGQTEDEAIQHAVAQFGAPEDLGGNLVRAWRRGEERAKKCRMRRRVRLSALFGTLGAVLFSSLLCLTGNPTPKESWNRQFPDHSAVYLEPHGYPSEFRIDHARGAVGITFGRCQYIYETGRSR